MAVKERKVSTTTQAVPAQRGGTASEAADGAPPKKRRKKLVVIVAGAVVLVAALGGAGWFLFLRTPPPPPPPEPGTVLVMEPISLNLAEGHYLKLGLALQFVYSGDKKAKYDGSKALDIAIDTFTGMSMAELSDPVRREEVQETLVHDVEEAYHHKVMDVYLTEFVMQ